MEEEVAAARPKVATKKRVPAKGKAEGKAAGAKGAAKKKVPAKGKAKARTGTRSRR